MKNKRKLKKTVTNTMAFIVGCAICAWYTVEILERLFN